MTCANSAKNRPQRELAIRVGETRMVRLGACRPETSCVGPLFAPEAITTLAFVKMENGSAIDINDSFYQRKFLRADPARLVRQIVERANCFGAE